jgi:hypothetical protein
MLSNRINSESSFFKRVEWRFSHWFRSLILTDYISTAMYTHLIIEQVLIYRYAPEENSSLYTTSDYLRQLLYLLLIVLLQSYIRIY